MLDADPGSPAFRKAGGMHECNNGHPITLDRLAGMLPPEYRWRDICENPELYGGGRKFSAVACRRDDQYTYVGKVDVDEHSARARVVAAVRMRSENV